MDEDSSFYTSMAESQYPQLFNFKHLVSNALARSGIRHEYYLPKDVFHPKFEAPKVLFFSDASTMSPDEVKAVREKYGNSGRIIVWNGAPGFLKAGNTYENISATCGFKVSLVPNDKANLPLFVKDSKDPLMKNMNGFIYQNLPWLWQVFSPHWKIDDHSAITLATFFGTDIPGLAVKRHKDFAEIFIGQPGAFSPQFIRNIAAEAGIQPYIDTDDVFSIGASLLTIGASTGDGIRKVNVPEGFKDILPLTDHKIIRKDKTSFDVDMKYKDAAVFKIIYK